MIIYLMRSILIASIHEGNRVCMYKSRIASLEFQGTAKNYSFEEKMVDNKNILSMKEVTYKLNVCTRTIYVWIEQGLFPRPIKLKADSRNIFFNKADIDVWMEKCSEICYKVKKGITPDSYKAKMQGFK